MSRERGTRGRSRGKKQDRSQGREGEKFRDDFLLTMVPPFQGRGVFEYLGTGVEPTGWDAGGRDDSVELEGRQMRGGVHMATERDAWGQAVVHEAQRTESKPRLLIRKTSVAAAGVGMVVLGLVEVVVPGVATPVLLGCGVGLILWQSGGKVAFRTPKWDREAKEAPPGG